MLSLNYVMNEFIKATSYLLYTLVEWANHYSLNGANEGHIIVCKQQENNPTPTQDFLGVNIELVARKL